MTFVDDEFADCDSIDLANLIKSRAIKASELTEVFISRIEKTNPTLNFMTNTAFDRARERALHIDPNTVFAGVPILIKDMIDVGGVPRTDGSKLMMNNSPMKNVAYIDAVEQAGLNILGMTNVPEFATGITTDNDLFGETRNPWNPNYSVFSSSGGSASAVASGVVSMAHGTDGGGSNRLPASATGIFGMKPSRGRMVSGEADGSHDIAKINHVLSRSVRESALMFSITEAQNGEIPPIGYVEGPSSNKLRIGILSDKSREGLQPDVSEALSNAAILLAEHGHDLVEVDFPVNHEEFARAYLAFFSTRLTPLRQMIEAGTGQSIAESGLVTPLVASGAEVLGKLSPDEIEKGMRYLETLTPHFANLFTSVDLLLTPVSHVVCPKLGSSYRNESWSSEIADNAIKHLQYTAPINFAGCPAIAIPLSIGRTSGLPVGSHLIAAEGQEQKLFEISYELEAAVNWKHKLRNSVG